MLMFTGAGTLSLDALLFQKGGAKAKRKQT
jgi:hypothetical protein